MDSTELHYLTYDPDSILSEMIVAYMDAGGDVLYPGDEKSMLLSTVQTVLIQAFAGVDNALRMGTLRYAAGEYLDMIGETRMCERIKSAAAAAQITITENSDSVARTIPKGSILSMSGGMTYALDSDVTVSGSGTTVSATVTCTQEGTAGNALTSGTQMTFVSWQNGVESVACAVSASGGMDAESDDDYRERIRTHGAANVTTGTALQYEAVAREVSTEIVDVKAVNNGAGKVKIYLILENATTASSVVSAVRTAVTADDVRPLTDQVEVAQATNVAYTLNVKYTAAAGTDISSAVTAAVAEYKEWQDNVIGQAFNPDRLMALLYQAGCTRVQWGTGSSFNGGDVEYTEIDNSKRCSGTITVTRTTS